MKYRGIFRVVISIRPTRVGVRAQSKSTRGSPFTVDSVTVTPADRTKKSVKSALATALSQVLPQTD